MMENAFDTTALPTYGSSLGGTSGVSPVFRQPGLELSRADMATEDFRRSACSDGKYDLSFWLGP